MKSSFFARAPLFCAILLTAFLLTGCTTEEGHDQQQGQPLEDGLSVSESGEQAQYDVIPMVMVGGRLYYDTGRENTLETRCGLPDGTIDSTVEGSEIPTQDNQSNFGAGFDYQYGADDDTLEIFIDGKWMVFEHREGTGRQVRFGDKMVDEGALSEETLEWLEWFNSLPETEQLAISSIPQDLLEAAGILDAEDQPAQAE